MNVFFLAFCLAVLINATVSLTSQFSVEDSELPLGKEFDAFGGGFPGFKVQK